MSQRVLPQPDVFATCPLDGKILEYYAGAFEAVYVLLHPFIHAVSISPALFKPNSYPTRSIIVSGCMPVSWKEVAARTNLPSIAAVDIGLRTMIRGLKPELENEEYSRRILSLIEGERTLPPPEGCFSDLIHDTVLSAIQSAGYEWVWIGDEFCMERKLHFLEDLKAQDSGPTVGACNVFTPDKALLWNTHWDSHFSFLCSSKQKLDAIVDANQLEGFFCRPSTEVYWSVRNANSF